MFYGLLCWEKNTILMFFKYFLNNQASCYWTIWVGILKNVHGFLFIIQKNDLLGFIVIGLLKNTFSAIPVFASALINARTIFLGY